MALTDIRIPSQAAVNSPMATMLQAIAMEAGVSFDVDDLAAVLGRPFLACAALDDTIDHWVDYAHDAFLVEAGRAFGFSIREIHPPRAALGLNRAAEFDQHFDASYRPLIHRALENGQPVLAWQGWKGTSGLAWGLIMHACEEEVGFGGATPWSPRDHLVRPPVQLYVVEVINPTRPDPPKMVELFLDHTYRILDNQLASRFGVATGAAGVDRWMAQIAVAGDDTAAHAAFAASIVNAHRSGLRFLERMAASGLIDSLKGASAEIIEIVLPLADASAVRSMLLTSEGRARLLEYEVQLKNITATLYLLRQV